MAPVQKKNGTDTPTPVTDKKEPSKEPTRITNDDLYRRSSQFRHWSFTKSQLLDIHISVNKRGIEVTKERISSVLKDLRNKTNSDDGDAGTSVVDKTAEMEALDALADQFEFVTCDEERIMLVACANNAIGLANRFKLPASVRATAITYLMRFFLMHSVMQYNPQHIMCSCLFLAAKAEDHFIGIKTFAKEVSATMKTSEETILQYEYLIMSTMKFTLLCHHPYAALYGFYLDIQNELSKIKPAILGKLYDDARKLVESALLTDVIFLYTPPQIALACLYNVHAALTERYLCKKFGLNYKNLKLASIPEKKEDGEVEVEVEVKAEEQVKSAEIDAEVAAAEDDDIEERETETPAPVAGAQEAEPVVKPEDDQPAVKPLTKRQRYEKMLDVVKECHEIIKDSLEFDTSEVKAISSKVRLCLTPKRFFSKRQKETTSVNVNANANGNENANEINSGSQKRAADEAEESDSKRVKVE